MPMTPDVDNHCVHLSERDAGGKKGVRKGEQQSAQDEGHNRNRDDERSSLQERRVVGGLGHLGELFVADGDPELLHGGLLLRDERLPTDVGTHKRTGDECRDGDRQCQHPEPRGRRQHRLERWPG